MSEEEKGKSATEYWDGYVKSRTTYRLVKGTSTRDMYDKNLLLEIMVGNLLGYIEELSKLVPNPTEPTTNVLKQPMMAA
jgi:hypothetical protein